MLLVISFINGWKVLNKDKQLNAKQFVLSLFFIGSFISPIFGRFFRSSLDFKYFYALVGKRDGNFFLALVNFMELTSSITDIGF